MNVEDRTGPRMGTTPPRGAPPVGGSPPAGGVDGEILALYGAGRREEACSLLYQIYWQSLRTIVHRRLHPWFVNDGLAEQTEDVAMQALHRVHASLERLAEAGTLGEIVALRAWILRIVQRQCWEAVERRARSRERLSETGEIEGATVDGDELPTEARIIHLIEGDRRLTDLRGCVADVTGRVGDALRLWLKGQTYQAVAQALAYASLSSAQSAVQAAIQKVARCMSAKGWAE